MLYLELYNKEGKGKMSEFNPKIKYNKKFYNNKFVRKVVIAISMMTNLYDAILDKKICGCSLVKYVPSLFRETKGATGSQSTGYLILDKIFENAKFTENDKFIDVGCGKARVLAYLLNKKFPGELYGIELNSEVAEYASKWIVKYPNVFVSCGDAFELDYNAYNILFLGRPFEPEFFKKYIAKLEQELLHPVTFYYWVDQQSGNYLNGRPGWTLHKREWIFRFYGMYLVPWPQRYSIWTFTPNHDLNDSKV